MTKVKNKLVNFIPIGNEFSSVENSFLDGICPPFTWKVNWPGYILNKLNELYPSPAIPLQHKDEYTLLVAVLLSAQCKDERVNKVTPFLFARADTPEKMIRLSVAEIEEIIRPLGLAPRKAKSIFELSKILIDKYQGKVPSELHQLEELPGVGHKTASVVLIQGFNKIAFPVDTHIHRLAKRWKLSSGKSVEQTEKDIKAQFPEETWSLLHLQMIYYGREFCPARGHDESKCIICSAVDLHLT